ncbi:MAG: acyltransferase family protein [Chloroflexi bacterium]|nr:acyltransferase family protein [Chloroflexota bacterium]
METKTVTRRYSLDWLRVMMILSVFIYHSTRFFNLGDWHIKNPITYGSVEVFENAFETWMMPLAFLISGATVFYALGKSGVGSFVKDKVLRLFVPLVVGIFTHSALQVYLERVSHGQFSGSFFEFYPHYFDGVYGLGGNFGWMGIHLWYLEMLFVFTLIFLPLFLLFKRGWGQRLLAGLGNALALPGAAFLLVIPAIVIRNGVPMDEPLGWDVFGGWGILSHAWFFVSGFVIASSERMQQSIQRLRWVWLIAAILLTATQVGHAIANPGEYSQVELQAYLWMLAFLGIAGKHVNFSTPRLQRANEGVLPFYILHQPVLIVIGYFVVQWAIPDPSKWAIIAAGSFAITIMLYEILVRRSNILRFLFGMRPLAQAPVAQARETVLARELVH